MSATNTSSRDPIPETFRTLDEFDAFWSTHSVADYEDLFEPVSFDVVLGRVPDGETITLDPETTRLLRQRAEQRGVSVGRLVNLLLVEKLHEPA